MKKTPIPIAYYAFEDDLQDSSEGENHAVDESDISFVGGAFGNAAEFNGVSSYITLPDEELQIGTEDYSVSFFVKTSGDNMRLVSLYGSKGWFEIYLARDIIGSIMFEGSSFGGSSFSMDHIINDGEWHHVAFVLKRDGNSILYIDGQIGPHGRDSALPLLGKNISIDANYNIGAVGFIRTRPGGNFFEGALDELKIYKLALTEEEVMEEYEGVLG